MNTFTEVVLPTVETKQPVSLPYYDLSTMQGVKELPKALEAISDPSHIDGLPMGGVVFYTVYVR